MNTLRWLMVEHGYVSAALRRKARPSRSEAVRPLQLVRMDFVPFYVHAQGQALLLLLEAITADCGLSALAAFW